MINTVLLQILYNHSVKIISISKGKDIKVKNKTICIFVISSKIIFLLKFGIWNLIN